MTELYERQLNFIEDILSFHPEFADIFSPEEYEVFRQYFLPDWDRCTDFKEYQRIILEEDPSIIEKATGLLRKFIDTHNVDQTGLLTDSTADSQEQGTI